ncbi:MAG: ABC transporter permease [Pseudomonadota bacterium]
MSEFPLPLPPGGAQTPRQSAGRWRTISALMLREMGTRYGRNPGGYVWAILEPAGIVVVMAVVFDLVLRSPSLGTSFILFYATGYLPYGLFQTLSRTVAQALRYSRPLLTYPAVSWIDAVTARALLNTLTGLFVSAVLFFGIITVLGLGVVPEAGVLLGAFGLAAVVGVGMGLVNCVLMGFFPVWDTIWGVLTRPLFLASGVLLIYEDLPRFVQDILWWNPLMHVTGLARTAFYPIYNPQYLSIAYVLFTGLVLAALGLLMLRRHHRFILQL